MQKYTRIIQTVFWIIKLQRHAFLDILSWLHYEHESRLLARQAWMKQDYNRYRVYSKNADNAEHWLEVHRSQNPTLLDMAYSVFECYVWIIPTPNRR